MQLLFALLLTGTAGFRLGMKPIVSPTAPDGGSALSVWYRSTIRRLDSRVLPSPSGRGASRWLALLACLSIGMRCLAAGVTTALTGATEAVPAGSRVSVWVNFLNPADQEATCSFAAEYRGQLKVENRTVTVALELRNPGEAGDARVPPGGFVRRQYGLQLPAGLEGKAVLEVAQLPGSSLLLTIAGPPSPGQSGAAPQGVPTEAPVDQADRVTAGDPVRFFKEHLFPHEPLYFIAGPDSPNAKFQISFKYRLFSADSWFARPASVITNFYAAYTQTSLWDWNKPSAPFFDSSYKPEFLFYHPRLARAGEDEWFRFDLQTGIQHESNGKAGADSRSLNIGYVRPTLIFGRPGGPQLSLSPRAWLYLGDLRDNPDLRDYRGYGDLRAVVGWADNVQLASTWRVGDDGRHGSVQLDLTYPLSKLPWCGLTWYLHAQYFTGYGESMLLYNQRSQAFRLGFSLYR
jgi:phospholipase A1